MTNRTIDYLELETQTDELDELQAVIYGITPPTWPLGDLRRPVSAVVIVAPQADRAPLVDARGRPA